jgi:hypothetical protein
VPALFYATAHLTTGADKPCPLLPPACPALLQCTPRAPLLQVQQPYKQHKAPTRLLALPPATTTTSSTATTRAVGSYTPGVQAPQAVASSAQPQEPSRLIAYRTTTFSDDASPMVLPYTRSTSSSSSGLMSLRSSP